MAQHLTVNKRSFDRGVATTVRIIWLPSGFRTKLRCCFDVIATRANQEILEYEYRRLLVPGVVFRIHPSRISYAGEPMVDREDCRKIREQRPDHIIIGAAGIEPYWGDRSRGERFEARLRESIESADITFGVQACVEALRRFGFKEIGILTGYRRMEEFQFNRYMREMGFDVVLSKEVPNEGVEEMKEAFRKLTMPPVGDRVQALLEIGTNLRCSRLASEMEEELGIPVISMNVATVWYVYRKNGIEDRVRGSGCLMWRF